MNKITKIIAEEIRDSQGKSTIKVTVWSGEDSGSFSVPSGASTGAHEAHVIENNKAILNVNELIEKALIGQDVLNQKEIDRILIELDGTLNKDNLGGNSMIGVSIACAKVAAKVSNLETFAYLRTLKEIKPSRTAPHLFMNLLEGGKHTENNIAFQEYLLVTNTENMKEAVDICIKVQNTLKEIITKNLGEESVILGDEGGFAPKLNDIKTPLIYLTEAIKQNNLQDEVYLSLDVASSSFYNDGKYKVIDPENKRGIDGKEITKEELLNIYNSLVKEFNLFSIEDPFEEEDFESFAELKKQNAHAMAGQANLLVVGDDLTVSNKELLQKAIKYGSINGMIIKPNQIGTLTETLETMQLARENNIELIISHRGEETDDDFIADLAYAFRCFGLKSGSPLRPERKVKYDRLIKISER